MMAVPKGKMNQKRNKIIGIRMNEDQQYVLTVLDPKKKEYQLTAKENLEAEIVSFYNHMIKDKRPLLEAIPGNMLVFEYRTEKGQLPELVAWLEKPKPWER